MMKKSISDECLTRQIVNRLNQPKHAAETTKSKSEEKFGARLHVPRTKEAAGGRVLSKLLKLKNKPPAANECRKNSILAFVDYENYDDLNTKLDMIKKSVMENLNKLKDRNVSLQDLEMKADYLSQHALNLNMVSTNIKKQQKAKMRVKYSMAVIVVLFIGASSVFSYLIYSGVFKTSL